MVFPPFSPIRLVEAAVMESEARDVEGDNDDDDDDDNVGQSDSKADLVSVVAHGGRSKVASLPPHIFSRGHTRSN